MPWLTIIMFVLSFILSKSKGMSNGKAALVATGVAAATYATVEPANTNSLWGDKVREYMPDTLYPTTESGTNGTFTADNYVEADGTLKSPSTTLPSFGSNVAALGSTAITAAADVAKSWGPGGTVAASVGLKSSGTISSFIKDHPWLLWVGGGLLAYSIIK